jgi:hypothetical protein
VRSHLLRLAFWVMLAGAASASNAAGPHRGDSIRPAAPVIGVYPNAAPAISPSFRHPIPRTRAHGARAFGGVAVPVFAGAPALFAPPVYAEQPAAYLLPPAEVAARPAPPPPPEREVIHHSDGRYELRGDGVSMPYRWVWIPNPPPPPSSGREVRVYGWIDEAGILHVTDRLDKVPERYRAQAQRNASS